MYGMLAYFTLRKERNFMNVIGVQKLFTRCSPSRVVGAHARGKAPMNVWPWESFLCKPYFRNVIEVRQGKHETVIEERLFMEICPHKAESIRRAVL